ncbi:MAG: Lar family restriction alleviation protein [Synergistaceae bacterium]|nr:Lar family restriction alleviation protein [Synergistaceae bacterium]MBR1602546.1 Lar family restriction alleviation protein [Synergistaceae bacterium]
MSGNKFELKPCPFCGSEDTPYVTHREYWPPDSGAIYAGFAGCAACDFYLATEDAYDYADEADNAAAELWNRRP